MNKLTEREYNLLRGFIDRHVLADVTREVGYILNQDDISAPYCVGDLNNRDLDSTIVSLSNKVSELEEQIEEAQESGVVSNLRAKVSYLTNTVEALKEENPLYGREAEVFTWYKVTPELAEILAEYGEVTIEDEDIWGRTSFGEPIVNDKVFEVICRELNIF